MAKTYNIKIFRGSTFKGLVIHCKDAANNNALPLTGYTPFAEIRKKPGASELVRNLNPSITDANAGIVSIPAIQDEETRDMQNGDFAWDFILQTPSGDRTEPLIKGSVTIAPKVTQPA